MGAGHVHRTAHFSPSFLTPRYRHGPTSVMPRGCPVTRWAPLLTRRVVRSSHEDLPRYGILPFTHLAREGRMTVTIGRRELLAALGGVAAAWPMVARALRMLCASARLSSAYCFCTMARNSALALHDLPPAYADALRAQPVPEARPGDALFNDAQSRPTRPTLSPSSVCSSASNGLASFRASWSSPRRSCRPQSCAGCPDAVHRRDHPSAFRQIAGAMSQLSAAKYPALRQSHNC